MKQFNLEEYKKNPSRKVVTRDGREARIVFTEAQNDNYPILALVQQKTETQKEQPHLFSTHGVYEVGRESCLDLFFADEEEKLTEFEKELNRIVQAFVDAHSYMDKVEIHHYAKGLLDFARKELIQIQDTMAYQEGVKEGRRLERQDIDKELDFAYKTRDEVVYLEGYDQGKEDTLKDLPKWYTSCVFFDKPTLIDDKYLHVDDCFISIPDLFEKLQKAMED